MVKSVKVEIKVFRKNKYKEYQYVSSEKFVKFTTLEILTYCIDVLKHGMQPRMISVDSFFVFFRLLFFLLCCCYM